MKYYIQFPDKLVFLILFPTLFQELIDSKFEIQMMCNVFHCDTLVFKDYSLNQIYWDFNSRQHVKVLHIDVILQDIKEINVNHKITSCIVLVLPEIIT